MIACMHASAMQAPCKAQDMTQHSMLHLGRDVITSPLLGDDCASFPALALVALEVIASEMARWTDLAGPVGILEPREVDGLAPDAAGCASAQYKGC